MKILLITSLLCGLLSASPTGELKDLGDAPLYEGGHFQGDMAGFDPNDRHAIVDEKKLWPNGVLYYELDSSVESIRSYILDGMKDYEEKTCITFRERTPDIKDYVRIYWWTGCWSMVGRIGGEQSMSLGTGCHWRGLVVHELGHALGFYHEQQRSDRDQYIEIFWENILEGLEDQFTIMNYWESNQLGEHFDYNSVMLYEDTAFSKDGVAITVKPKQHGITLIPVWKKNGLSESDVKRVNRLYQCSGNVRPPPPEVPDFICDFGKDACGITNQENMGAQFNRRLTTIGGHTSTMMVMQNQDVEENSVGARLVTPHFQNFGRSKACLSFHFYMDGTAIQEMSVSLQGVGTYEVASYKEPSNGWKTFSRTIDYADNDPRMFILAVRRVGNSDFTFAIDNLVFTLKPCANG